MKPILKMFALALSGILCAPVFGATTPVNPAGPGSAQPGTINFVEGSASLDGAPVRNTESGAAVEPDQVLSTGKGKAEMLLTPGVFFRLDDNSAVKMVTPNLTKTQVELERGRAAVEVDMLLPQNDLEVIDAGVVTQLIKPGFYEFDADSPTAKVFRGEAAVEVSDGKYKVVKQHHEFALTQGPNAKPIAKEKPASFDTRAAQDDLYNWSSLRSSYLANANNEIAGEYAYAPNFAPGWYWDPYMWDYTFIGMDPFWSPFGFGFFPPWYGGFYGGYYGGYYGGGFGGGRYYPHHGPLPGRGFGGGVHGSFGGTHGGFGGMHGGFGGGGMHGGGGRR